MRGTCNSGICEIHCSQMRKNMYRIACDMRCDKENACVIALDDQTVCRLSSREWYDVISEGLRHLGYVSVQNVESVVVEFCETDD